MTDLTKLRDQLVGARALVDTALTTVDTLIERVRAAAEDAQPEPEKPKGPATFGRGK